MTLAEDIRASGVKRDRNGWPTAYVLVDGSQLYALIEGIEGLAPQRETTADERVRGIESLDPPVVMASDWNELVDLALEATDEAVRSTLGTTPNLGASLMLRWKTAMQVRGALSDAGVDA